MKPREFSGAVMAALRRVRLARLLALIMAAILAGLASDWLREGERVVFPPPLPPFVSVPAAP